jgi:hypothetical protein
VAPIIAIIAPLLAHWIYKCDALIHIVVMEEESSRLGLATRPRLRWELLVLAVMTCGSSIVRYPAGTSLGNSEKRS